MLLRRPKTPRLFAKKDKDRDPWESPFVSFFNEDGADPESLGSSEREPESTVKDDLPRLFPITSKKVFLPPEEEVESKEAALDTLFWGPRPEAISFSRLNASYEAQVQRLPRGLSEETSNQEKSATKTTEKTPLAAPQEEAQLTNTLLRKSTSTRIPRTGSYKASTAWSKRYLERFVERATHSKETARPATAWGHSDDAAILLEEDRFISPEVPPAWLETSSERTAEDEVDENFIFQDGQDLGYSEEDDDDFSSSVSSGLPPQIRQSGEAYLAQAKHYLEEFSEEPEEARGPTFAKSLSSNRTDHEASRSPSQGSGAQELSSSSSTSPFRAEQAQRGTQEPFEDSSEWRDTKEAFDSRDGENQARPKASSSDESFFPSFPRRRMVPRAKTSEPSADSSSIRQDNPNDGTFQDRVDFFPPYPRRKRAEASPRSETIPSPGFLKERVSSSAPESPHPSVNLWEPQSNETADERFFPSSTDASVKRSDFFQETRQTTAGSPFSIEATPPPRQEKEPFSDQNSFTSEDVFFPEALDEDEDEFLNDDEFSEDVDFSERNFSPAFEEEQHSVIRQAPSATHRNSRDNFFSSSPNRSSTRVQPAFAAHNSPSPFPSGDDQRLVARGFSSPKEERINVKPSPRSDEASFLNQRFVSPKKGPTMETKAEGSPAPVEPSAAPRASRNTFLRRLFSRKKAAASPFQGATPESPEVERELQEALSPKDFPISPEWSQAPQPYRGEQVFQERLNPPQTSHSSGESFNQPLHRFPSRRFQDSPQPWRGSQNAGELPAEHHQAFRNSGIAAQPDSSNACSPFRESGFSSQEAQLLAHHQDTRVPETTFDRFDPHQRLFEAETMFQSAYPQAQAQNPSQHSGFQQAQPLTQTQPNPVAFSGEGRSSDAVHWSPQHGVTSESLRQASNAPSFSSYQAFSSSEASPPIHQVVPEAFGPSTQSRPSYEPDAATNQQSHGSTPVGVAYSPQATGFNQSAYSQNSEGVQGACQTQASPHPHQRNLPLPAANPYRNGPQIDPNQKLFEADPQEAIRAKPQAETSQAEQSISQASSPLPPPPPLSAAPLIGSFSSARRRLFNSDAFLTIVLAAGVLLFCVLLLWGISRRSPAPGTEAPLIKIPSPKAFKIRPEEPRRPLIPYQDELIYGELDPEDKAKADTISERLLPMPSFAPELVIEEEPSEDEYLDDVLAPYQDSENEDTSNEKAAEKAPHPPVRKESKKETLKTSAPPQRKVRTPTKAKERSLTRSVPPKIEAPKSSSETSPFQQSKPSLSASLKEKKNKPQGDARPSEGKTIKRTSAFQTSNRASSKTSSPAGHSMLQATSNASEKSSSKVSSPISVAEKGFEKSPSKTAKVTSQRPGRDSKSQATTRSLKASSKAQLHPNASMSSFSPVSKTSTPSPFYVQLGILPTIESARKESARLVSKYRTLAQQKLIVRPVKTEEGKTIFRLLVGPFSSRAEADKISQTLGTRFKILG